jgi:hypothetical protein
LSAGSGKGAPLAPYLFLVVTEVLNNMVTQEAEARRVRRIWLPMDDKQQIMAQYADDTTFTLSREEVEVRNLISLLNSFCAASGLIIN